MWKQEQPLWGGGDAVNFVLHFEIRQKIGPSAIWARCKCSLRFCCVPQVALSASAMSSCWPSRWKHYGYSKRRNLLHLATQRKIPEDLKFQAYRTSHLALSKYILCRGVILEKLVVSHLMKNYLHIFLFIVLVPSIHNICKDQMYWYNSVISGDMFRPLNGHPQASKE